MRHLVKYLCVAPLLLALPSPVRAQIACGGVVGPSGTFTLSSDLDCRQDPACAFPRRCNPAVTVTGNAVLNLNGHTVTCSSGDDDGVRLSGAGAVLRDGATNICGVGVRIAGDGRHVVRNVASLRSKNDGFVIESDDNVLESCIADTSGRNGFRLEGARGNVLARNVAARTGVFNGFNVSGGSDGNRLRDNVAIDSAANGFNVNDDRNKLVQNAAIGNGNRGFQLNGDANTMRANRAVANGVGIEGGGERNLLERNTALGNEQVDLSEPDAACDDVWRRSVFGTTGEPACVD